MTKTVLIDIDGVTANLHSVWLSRYNFDYNDALSINDITEWSIHNFVKSECGLKIYEYVKDPLIYDDVPLIEDAVESIKTLRYFGLRTVFLSSGINIGKLEFLKRHSLVKDDDDIVIAKDKSLVRGDFMVDDYFKNILSFYEANPNGTAILFNAPYNAKSDYPVRAGTWKDVVKIIRHKIIFELEKATR